MLLITNPIQTSIYLILFSFSVFSLYDGIRIRSEIKSVIPNKAKFKNWVKNKIIIQVISVLIYILFFENKFIMFLLHITKLTEVYLFFNRLSECYHWYQVEEQFQNSLKEDIKIIETKLDQIDDNLKEKINYIKRDLCTKKRKLTKCSSFYIIYLLVLIFSLCELHMLMIIFPLLQFTAKLLNKGSRIKRQKPDYVRRKLGKDEFYNWSTFIVAWTFLLCLNLFMTIIPNYWLRPYLVSY